MEDGEGRVICVMRRYRRAHLPLRHEFWGWKDRGYATSGEMKFELLEAPGRKRGQVIYEEHGTFRRGRATTPWGEATIALEDGLLRTGRRGRFTVTLGDRLVSRVTPGPAGYVLSFPDRADLSFKPSSRFHYEHKGEAGSVVVQVEDGWVEDQERLPAPPLSRGALDGLPKEDRPRSADSNRYTQYTIRKSGVIAVDEDDLVLSLVMVHSNELLEFEIMSGT